MQIVDLVVNQTEFAVRSRRLVGRGLEATWFHRIVMAAKPMPRQVITEVGQLGPLLHLSRRMDRHAKLKVIGIEAVVLHQVTQQVFNEHPP